MQAAIFRTRISTLSWEKLTILYKNHSYSQRFSRIFTVEDYWSNIYKGNLVEIWALVILK
jgi:hypothetical protein